jgi:hypothetical protein
MSSTNSTNDQLLLKKTLRECLSCLIARASTLHVYFLVVYSAPFAAVMLRPARVRARLEEQ